jgi:hypothetical protein
MSFFWSGSRLDWQHQDPYNYASYTCSNSTISLKFTKFLPCIQKFPELRYCHSMCVLRAVELFYMCMYINTCSSTNLRKSQCHRILEKRKNFVFLFLNMVFRWSSMKHSWWPLLREKGGDDIAPPLRQSPRLHGNGDGEQLGNRDVSRNLFGN